MLGTLFYIDQLSYYFIVIKHTPDFIPIKFLLPGMEVNKDVC
jgi:hypothetical protein